MSDWIGGGAPKTSRQLYAMLYRVCIRNTKYIVLSASTFVRGVQGGRRAGKGLAEGQGRGGRGRRGRVLGEDECWEKKGFGRGQGRPGGGNTGRHRSGRTAPCALRCRDMARELGVHVWHVMTSYRGRRLGGLWVDHGRTARGTTGTGARPLGRTPVMRVALATRCLPWSLVSASMVARLCGRRRGTWSCGLAAPTRRLRQ